MSCSGMLSLCLSKKTSFGDCTRIHREGKDAVALPRSRRRAISVEFAHELFMDNSFYRPKVLFCVAWVRQLQHND